MLFSWDRGHPGRHFAPDSSPELLNDAPWKGTACTFCTAGQQPGGRVVPDRPAHRQGLSGTRTYFPR